MCLRRSKAPKVYLLMKSWVLRVQQDSPCQRDKRRSLPSSPFASSPFCTPKSLEPHNVQNPASTWQKNLKPPKPLKTKDLKPPKPLSESPYRKLCTSFASLEPWRTPSFAGRKSLSCRVAEGWGTSLAFWELLSFWVCFVDFGFRVFRGLGFSLGFYGVGFRVSAASFAASATTSTAPSAASITVSTTVSTNSGNAT